MTPALHVQHSLCLSFLACTVSLIRVGMYATSATGLPLPVQVYGRHAAGYAVVQAPSANPLLNYYDSPLLLLGLHCNHSDLHAGPDALSTCALFAQPQTA